MRAIALFREMFNLRTEDSVNALAASILTKSLRVFSLTHGERGSVSRDISTLDPTSDDAVVSGWGGLAGLSARIAEAVGDAITELDALNIGSILEQ
jgi:hypothetical protein